MSANAASAQGLQAAWLIDSNENGGEPLKPIANLTCFAMTQFFLKLHSCLPSRSVGFWCWWDECTGADGRRGGCREKERREKKTVFSLFKVLCADKHEALGSTSEGAFSSVAKEVDLCTAKTSDSRTTLNLPCKGGKKSIIQHTGATHLDAPNSLSCGRVDVFFLASWFYYPTTCLPGVTGTFWRDKWVKNKLSWTPRSSDRHAASWEVLPVPTWRPCFKWVYS